MHRFIAALESRTLFTADLVGSLTITPAVHLIGEKAGITATVKNNGTGTIFPSMNTVVLSSDTLYGNKDDIFVNTFAANSLGAGVALSKALTPTLNAAGNYFVIIKVDALNSVPESSESNVFVTDAPVISVASNNLPSGPLTGTLGNDVLLLTQRSGKLIVTFNGESRAGDAPASLFIDAAAGNDKVIADATVTVKLAVTGAGGNDTIVGGSGDDELSGANGSDRIFGGSGDDFLIGGAQPDSLWGEAGNDLLLGAGGNDRLIDVVGRDWFIGGNGNDTIIARDTTSDGANDPDTVSGNAGVDRAQVDAGTFPDTLASIEELLA
jgi:Ca2+-binding RTX toxin-like protein